MNRVKRMQPAVRVAERNEQEAAKRLGASQRQLTESEVRLAELNRYREEYRALMQQSGAGGISGARFQALHRFLVALDVAISQQERTVVLARGERERQMRLWMESRGKVKALGKVVERYLRDEQQEELRREQKETDEWSHRRG